MIQITDWLEPNDEFYVKDRLITNKEWLDEEATRISTKTGKSTTIKQNENGNIALFRQQQGENFAEKKIQ